MKKRITILGTVMFLFSAISFSQVENGLVGKYSFNQGNANNEMPGKHGVVTGATLTTDRFGNLSHAYYFDGQDDYITLGDSSIIKPVEGSISLWARMTAVSNAGAGMVYNPIFISRNSDNKGSKFEGCGIYLQMNANPKILAITTDSVTESERYMFSNQTVIENEWKHYVITYNFDSLSFYVDGELQNTIFKGFNSYFSVTDSVVLGATIRSQLRYFNGSIDDVRIYNRVINSSEVDELFNEPDPTTVSIADFGNPTSLKFYPNPATSQLSVLGEMPKELLVYDLLGNKVTQVSSSKNINVESLARGQYILQAIYKDKTVSNKFIKQ